MWKRNFLAAGIIALLAMPVFAESTTQWMTGYYGLEGDTDTVGLWHLDDSLADATGNGYDYTFTSGGYAAGKFNNGMGFPTTAAMMGVPGDGSADHFGVAGSDQTLECWIRPDGAQVSYATIIYGVATEGLNLMYDATGTYLDAMVYIEGIGPHHLVGTTPITLGQWHHIAFTRDISTGEEILYLDGKIEATYANYEGISLGGSYTTYTWPHITGRDPFTESCSFDGVVDEIRLSSVVRTFEIPEPATAVLLVAGAGLAVLRKRRTA